MLALCLHPLTYSAPPLISDLDKIELKGLQVFRLLRRLSLDLTQPTLHPHHHDVFQHDMHAPFPPPL